MTLNELAKEVHKNAVTHGWWDKEPSFPEIAMLCVSELSEALEEYRDAKPNYHAHYMGCDLGIKCTETELLGENCPPRNAFAAIEDGACPHNTGKPQGIAVELADCILRILDYCGAKNIDIETATLEKHKYNKTRPYKHGGKII